MQIKNFVPEMARFIKLRALKNTFGDDVAGYAEVVIFRNQKKKKKKWVELVDKK
jgi:hypothetical protein